jgi:hypothetical protein
VSTPNPNLRVEQGLPVATETTGSKPGTGKTASPVRLYLDRDERIRHITCGTKSVQRRTGQIYRRVLGPGR